jgi:hypothetical protein
MSLAFTEAIGSIGTSAIGSCPIGIESCGGLGTEIQHNLYIGEVEPKSDDQKESIYIGDTRTIFLVKKEERIDLFATIKDLYTRLDELQTHIYAWWTRI